MTAMRRFSCFLVGENSLLVSCAELLLARGHRVLGVVSPVAGIRAWAEQNGLPTAEFGPGLVPFLAAEPFDLLFSVANLRMLPRDVLALPRLLPVNFHDGPLPRHAGLYATTWAVLGNARHHAVSWHVMTEQADAGDVLVQRAVEVEPGETSRTLNLKCLQAGTDSFGELVAALEQDRITRQPQDLAQRSYHGYAERPPGAGFLIWDRPAEELAAAVRARDFGPHTNAFGTAKAVVGDEPALVGAAEVLAARSGKPPGTVLAVGPAGAVTVATADRDLRLTRLTSVHGEPLRAGPTGRLATPDSALLAAAERAEGRSLRGEAFWVRRLAALVPGELPCQGAGSALVPVPEGLRGERLLTAFLAFLVRIGVTPGSDIRLRLPGWETGHPVVDALYADWVPLRVPEPGEWDLAGLCGEVAGQLREAKGPIPYDLWTRYPQLRTAARSLPVVVELAAPDAGPAVLPPGASLLIRIPGEPGPCQWVGADGQLAEYAAAFLRALADAPRARLSEVPLGTTGALRAMASWNDTAAELPLTRPVHRLIARQAGLRPDSPAVTSGTDSLSYGELEHRSSELAGQLRARGVGPGHRVGVFLERTTDLVVTLLGVLKSGAAYVPLAPLYPPARIAEMLDDAGPVLVVTDAALIDGLPPTGADILVLGQRTAVDTVDGADVPADADAYVIYTSGSTGRPKGVRISHRSLTNFVCAMASEPGFTERDRLLAVTTVCFDIAGLELFVPLVTGGRVELAPTETAADGFRLRALLEHSRPSVMQATPATWRMLLDAGWQGPPLRMLCGGEALPPDLAEALLATGSELWNMYGPTETTIWAAAGRVRPGQPPVIGRPIANTRFHVLDTALRPLPPGVPGELFIGGEQVAAGYLNRPELTAERFLRVPGLPGVLYRTGDLVRQLGDGQLAYLGRLDSQLKVRGYRIEPGEIEVVLRGHPAVAQALVVLREERLVGYVVPCGRPVAPGQLREHLAARLPGYMVPGCFVTLDRIPLTANGKTDRRALPAPSSARRGGVEARDRTEQAVAEVWREVLRLDQVGAEENFFELGGDSVLLLRVLARLRDQAQVPLTRVEMFRYPTIRALARRLGSPGALDAVPVAETPVMETPVGGRAALGELRRRRGK